MSEHEGILLREGKDFLTRMDSNGHIRVNPPVSDFPGELWFEWDEDCKTRFNHMRWLKMWSDHLVAIGKIGERDKLVEKVLIRLSELNEEPTEEKSEQATKDEEVKTFR